jgi:hypothetical protein
MRAKYMGREKRDYTRAETGEVGTEHTVQLLVPEGVRILRVPEDLYNSVSGLEQGSDVQLHIALVPARFGNHYPAVQSILPVAAR